MNCESSEPFGRPKYHFVLGSFCKRRWAVEHGFGYWHIHRHVVPKRRFLRTFPLMRQ